jgi:hypothetical protein
MLVHCLNALIEEIEPSVYFLHEVPKRLFDAMDFCGKVIGFNSQVF